MTSTPSPPALEAFSTWRLTRNTPCYGQRHGLALGTQAAAGRLLLLLEAVPPNPAPGARQRVRLAEDGYPCFMDCHDLLSQQLQSAQYQPLLLASSAIQGRLGEVLGFAHQAMATENRYLLGGTHAPNYDCSGLVQAAFAHVGVWIPRDAYQQERFCQPVAISADDFRLLRPGDLVFFGTPEHCTHVGLHLDQGRYMHSSSSSHGHGRIAVDALDQRDTSPVASHYRRHLRGAGRVVRCHDGATLP
ncbi:MAG: NlpC/P60 family protein [Synechococcus sp. SB0676_bin_10]|uniref:NlpC/P60 family protein n=1 Tax=Synechococcus sp. SB0676_bin_10 TaxID=2604869 RepID=A0A6B1FBS7_9SYNE|nr:NlpC/P60 family protein [Synechococcus sp. SB0664_bin_36]MYG38694.1 NlpC/P60 family protein [Synechococcus sp. SB0676_bin_10]MYK07079.1 NlpC/P60 family protein [Synechococcus sp. SB0670_bin_20]